MTGCSYYEVHTCFPDGDREPVYTRHKAETHAIGKIYVKPAWFKATRERMGWGQEFTASQLGVTRRKVRDWEEGKKKVTPEEITPLVVAASIVAQLNDCR